VGVKVGVGSVGAGSVDVGDAVGDTDADVAAAVVSVGVAGVRLAVAVGVLVGVGAVVAVGGGVSGTTWRTAASASSRGTDRLTLGCLTGAPDLSRMRSISAGRRPSSASSRSAATPAAIGEAFDVPAEVETPPLSAGAVVHTPGATIERARLTLLKQAMVTGLVASSKHPLP
jgi:hypothetical protein